MIRIERIWLATEPLDMRGGPDSCLARVVQVFGSAEPHQDYVYLNNRANRLKVLVHDGFGLWLAARRLHQSKFIPARVWQQHPLELTRDQLDALVVSLPWHQVGTDQAIAVL